MEAILTEMMRHTLECVVIGFGGALPLRCEVTAACCGFTTALCCSALGLLTVRRWWGAFVGVWCGLALNVVRICVIEMSLRMDAAFGQMVHDTALYTVYVPVVLGVAWVWRRMDVGKRLFTAVTASVVLIALFGTTTSKRLPNGKPNYLMAVERWEATR